MLSQIATLFDCTSYRPGPTPGPASTASAYSSRRGSAEERAARYACIAGPVSIRTRSIRWYPFAHSFGSTSDSPPAYGLRSPGSASDPE